MSSSNRVLTLHAEAIHTATTYVSQVRERDLQRPTPCAEWSVAALLAHMVGQHRGFARAARLGHAPKEAYRPERFTHGRWLDSAFELLGAFADADPEDTIIEVELHPTRPLSLDTVVGAQLLDTAVHTWDVARAIGLPYTPTEDLAAEVLRVAETVPDTPSRTRPGSAFAPGLPAPEGASDWERALTMLGRDPLQTRALPA